MFSTRVSQKSCAPISPEGNVSETILPVSMCVSLRKLWETLGNYDRYERLTAFGNVRLHDVSSTFHEHFAKKVSIRS